MRTEPVLPGRLGRPELTLRDDPRADPRMVAVLEPLGMAGELPPSPIGEESPIEAILEFVAAAEPMVESFRAGWVSSAPPVEGVTTTVEVIKGNDDNDIKLFIHRPTASDGLLPGILHLHGGGMAMLSAAGASYTRWREELAAAGLVVVGVEFRNSAGALGPFPFPAGLNDCTSALRWMAENKHRLGISKIVVSGDSGGGNLTLATTLKAKFDGEIALIDGVYAMCPAIAFEHPSELASRFENDGFAINIRSEVSYLLKLYDPSGANRRNPLVAPYYASDTDLGGLPPHVISVNELDPIRDDGLVYFRRLLRAGVSASSRTVNGTCHAADCMFRTALPEAYLGTVRDIKGFADSL